jgi:hypothetical protein
MHWVIGRENCMIHEELQRILEDLDPAAARKMVADLQEVIDHLRDRKGVGFSACPKVGLPPSTSQCERCLLVLGRN